MPPKKTRCGTCSGCTAELFCGTCRTCTNMVRFNGPGTMKKPCLLRACVAPLVAHSPVPTIPEIDQPLPPPEIDQPLPPPEIDQPLPPREIDQPLPPREVDQPPATPQSPSRMVPTLQSCATMATVVQTQAQEHEHEQGSQPSTYAEVDQVLAPRKTKCGTCSGCTAEQFCGTCRTCRNMLRFNGTGTMKKPCLLRTCVGPLVAHSPAPIVPPEIDQPPATPQSPSSTAPTLQPSNTDNSFSEPSGTSSQLLDSSSQPSTSAGLDQEVAPILENKTLGFAKTRTNGFFPARKIGEVGGGGLVRVKWFATGQVGLVAKDCWTTYSEQKLLRFSKDRSVNKVQFAKAVEEMLAMLDRLERDGELELEEVDQLHPVSLVASKKQPAAARKLEKLCCINLEHSETLTAAAMAEFIVSGKGRMLHCKECPWFKTDN